jgi:putative membrane protein insertion efficiency factor
MARLLLALIRLYQRLLSPLLGSRCRFHPNCSEYARVSVARFGAARGGVLAIWRILRCQPFSEGGIDEVPLTFTLRRSQSRPDDGDHPSHE